MTVPLPWELYKDPKTGWFRVVGAKGTGGGQMRKIVCNFPATMSEEDQEAHARLIIEACNSKEVRDGREA